VQGATQYQLRDGGIDRMAPEKNYGLVRRDYSHKPAYAAFWHALGGRGPFRVSVRVARTRLRRALRAGLRVSVRCPAACRVRAGTRLRRGPRVRSGAVRRRSAGRLRLRLRFRPRQRRYLARRRRARLTISVTARGPAGERVTVRRRVVLRR